MGGDVNLSGGIRDDVNLDKLLPQRANAVVILASAAGGFDYEFIVKGGIALGVQSKL